MFCSNPCTHVAAHATARQLRISVGPCTGYYPHKHDFDGLVPVSIRVADHPAVTTARKGDVLRIMRRSDPGWRHKWTVEDFTMTLYFKR